MITIYFDGLCEPFNPGGVATYGFVVDRIEGDNKECLKEGYGVVGKGWGMTNNVAEYEGLLNALLWLAENNIDGEITIKGDSMLAIKQLQGLWKVKSHTSRKYVPQIKELLKGRKVTFQWIPREQNKKADELSRIAYRQYIGKSNYQKRER